MTEWDSTGAPCNPIPLIYNQNKFSNAQISPAVLSNVQCRQTQKDNTNNVANTGGLLLLLGYTHKRLLSQFNMDQLELALLLHNSSSRLRLWQVEEGGLGALFEMSM